jgi:hypothetical protein
MRVVGTQVTSYTAPATKYVLDLCCGASLDWLTHVAVGAVMPCWRVLPESGGSKAASRWHAAAIASSTGGDGVCLQATRLTISDDTRQALC